MEQFKAVSQNLMHSSITITDGIYGNLKEDDVRAAIASLGADQANTQAGTPGDLSSLLKALAALQSRPDLVQELLKG